jgi:hypothetical protein
LYRTLVYALGISVSEVFGKFGAHGWYHWTPEEQWAVIYAQNFLLISFVWYLGKAYIPYKQIHN